jgi:DNA recombination protein RmuC
MEPFVLAGIGLVLVLQLVLVLRKQSVDLQPIFDRLEGTHKSFARLEDILDREHAQAREESARRLFELREETARALADNQEQMVKSLTLLGESQRAATLKLTEATEHKLDTLRDKIDQRLLQLQTENTAQLEKMRVTVDEKLQGTLEKRLGESFKQVSERLELVHKGLGEMQHLATGVGDLKKVLTNVKTRGMWGEVQLGAILSEILSHQQYAENVRVNPNTSEVVEFAVRLPGRGASESELWLPIDAKFPIEDYQRFVAAQEQADLESMEEARKSLEARIKQCAKDISSKYIQPPHTTDFAIMFLPLEGLYAEVAQRRGLIETLQRDYRVVVNGPSNFAAFLNSLQMGFRTLAIEKRSSEVWALLGAVKNEFGKFGDTLDAVKKKLEAASNQMNTVSVRSRQIERKLKNVEVLPSADVASPLALEELNDDTLEDDSTRV